MHSTKNNRYLAMHWNYLIGNLCKFFRASAINIKLKPLAMWTILIKLINFQNYIKGNMTTGKIKWYIWHTLNLLDFLLCTLLFYRVGSEASGCGNWPLYWQLLYLFLYLWVLFYYFPCRYAHNTRQLTYFRTGRGAGQKTKHNNH